jgi:hypothetical protein
MFAIPFGIILLAALSQRIVRPSRGLKKAFRM